jgi:pimeloyl-ACP methyl ester carboxylesterase
VTPLRILLVPSLTELEWPIRPLIEAWADVASFDAPAVEGQSPVEGDLLESTVERGLAELERRSWDRCVVVGDEWGAAVAASLAAARPAAVQALVLGHACLHYRRDGERPSLNPEVADMFLRLARLDFRAFARQMFAAWDPRRDTTREAQDHETVADQYLKRVPPEAAAAFMASIISPERSGEVSLEVWLHGLDVPLLLVKHEGCVLFTPEGYEDAVAALPRAKTATTLVKPSVSPEFADILREFCQAVVSDRSPAIRPG